MNRYLAAFERSALRRRRDELTDTLSATLHTFPAARLERIADHITEITNGGTDPGPGSKVTHWQTSPPITLHSAS